MKNINVNGLYVASVIWDEMEEIEPWVQYESFGRMKHNLIVSSKRVLVYSKEENGEINYYDVKTGKKVRILKHLYNFETSSSCLESVFAELSRANKMNLLGRLGNDIKIIGCLVPCSQFFVEKIGINPEKLSLKNAQILLKIYNLTMAGKSFRLSDDENKSTEIINRKLKIRTK